MLDMPTKMMKTFCGIREGVQKEVFPPPFGHLKSTLHLESFCGASMRLISCYFQNHRHRQQLEWIFDG
uniref:Ovule protein n=1 Tax=Romanomermis culicivorax TaxID=13658 RepID=A0A915J4Z1_ROMCU